MKKEYAIIETLNGHLRLKESSKVTFNDYVQLEIYADSLEDAKLQFAKYKKELKEIGIL